MKTNHRLKACHVCEVVIMFYIHDIYTINIIILKRVRNEQSTLSTLIKKCIDALHSGFYIFTIQFNSIQFNSFKTFHLVYFS